MKSKYDFGGWATRFNIRCADGRTIRDSAFADCDGLIVPLVYNHQHGDTKHVLGHALLEYRPGEGMYTYGSFNDTERGRDAKEQVKHGDIRSLSIYANGLQQMGGDVIHGAIREVSLVLAGANPGAYIDTVIAHSELSDEEATISFVDDELGLEVFHAEEASEGTNKSAEPEDTEKENKEMAEETVKDVYDTLSEKQKDLVNILVGMALDEQAAKDEKNEEGEKDDMKHNVFESDVEQDNYLSHAEQESIMAEARRCGSFREAVLAHGITNIEVLFPEVQSVNKEPELVQRDDEWVAAVMNAVHKTPFSRIKSTYANITADEARARGYIKGKKKVDEVIAAFKRTTTPTTIYKKQSLDRDDILDITDFDVAAFLKGEMTGMMHEELARAILVGDGRSTSSDDKINELNIRPVWTDDDVYTVKSVIEHASTATPEEMAKMFIKQMKRSRKEYKGSGNPTLFITEDLLTEMLMIEDKNERVIYDTVEKLCTALRVSKIVAVPVFEGLTRDVSGATHTLAAIMVNLKDYNVGTDKGGQLTMFDDFDIDYNKQKYLMETRCSGAMIKPYSAIAYEFKPAA